MDTHHATAVGLAIVGPIGLLVVPFLQQGNGAWLVTGALIVLKPELTAIVRAASARAAGTILGAVLAGVVAALTHQPWVLLAVAFIATWWAESLVRRSFGVFVVLITPLAVLLGNIVVPGDWEIALLRAMDVLIGSAMAVLVVSAIATLAPAAQSGSPA